MATYKRITQRKPKLVPETEMGPALRSGTGGTHPLLQLQRTHGNRYVQRLVARSKPDRALIQPKLRVGPANDRYEQEADQIAQQVTQRPGPGEVIPGRTTSSLQRVGGEGGFEAGNEVESRIATQRGSGQRLPESVRAQIEPRLGADFSGVRVHTDTEADALNQSLKARAFTTGKDIFFRLGEYQPGSSAGQQLLAHELSHVVQQNPGQAQPGNEAQHARPASEPISLIQRKREVGGEELLAYLKHTSRSQNQEEAEKVESRYEASRKRGEKFEGLFTKWKADKTGSRVEDQVTYDRILEMDYSTVYEWQAADARLHMETGRGASTPQPFNFVPVKDADGRELNRNPGDYENYYYPQTGKLVAHSNTKEADEGRNPSLPPPIENSEMIWYNYNYALALLQSLPQRGNLKTIIRESIINKQTLDTIFLCDHGGEAVFSKTEQTTREPEDDFWALLGTPNGNSAAWLLIQHGMALGAEAIDTIRYKEDELAITYQYPVLAP